MYFKLLCSEVSVLPTDIAHLIALFTDYTTEFYQFARDVADTIDPDEYFRRDAIDMLKYAHYMKVPFFFKPDLARTHLKVAQQIREMFRGDVYNCGHEVEPCGNCAYCFSDNHRLGWKVFMDPEYGNSLKLDYDVVPTWTYPYPLDEFNTSSRQFR